MGPYEKYIKAFAIFAKYPHVGDLSAEHDTLYALPSPDSVSEEDLAELDTLGWHPDEGLETFYCFV